MEKNIHDTTAAAGRPTETRRRGVTAAGSQPRQTTAFVFLARFYNFIYYYYTLLLYNMYNIHRDNGLVKIRRKKRNK